MIDPARHRSVFSPGQFGDRRVDVIGVGATGSRIALGLAKLGVQNIHAWDFDRVEEHNIANQLYGVNDVGSPKVEALDRLIRQQTGEGITCHDERVTGATALGEVVFLLTDTMLSRRRIFEGAVAGRSSKKLMIETRMGVDEGRVYTVEPWSPVQAQRWLGTLYDDDDASVQASLCGTTITLGATADLVSGFALWQFIKWVAMGDSGLASPNADDRLVFEMIFGGRYPSLVAF